jgi:NADH-quinone oxidoreductase subunit C
VLTWCRKEDPRRVGIPADELDFTFLTTMCGMHFPGLELELGVVYHLHSMRNGHRIRVKSRHPEG